jgi:hypothetical protein
MFDREDSALFVELAHSVRLVRDYTAPEYGSWCLEIYEEGKLIVREKIGGRALIAE